MLFKLPAFMSWITKMRPLWGHSGSTGSLEDGLMVTLDGEQFMIYEGEITQTG